MKKTHVYYTPMSKRQEQSENKSTLDDSEFPPLSATKSSESTSVTTILNFLQAAKKTPEPEPEPEKVGLTCNDDANANANANANDKDVPLTLLSILQQPYKKGLSFE